MIGSVIVKKIQKIYYILTYIFFIYPPFIFGLVEIYKEGNKMETHIVTLIVNIILILVLLLICGLLIYYKKLHVPSEREIKYLVFGFVGNIVVYFYTFQNDMNIYNIVNTYLVLLIVLVVHYFLISKKITVWELWILMPIFLFVDYLNIALTGCGFSNEFNCNPRTQFDLFLYFVYSILLITIIGYYSYKIYLYKYLDILKIANISLILIASFLIQDLFYVHDDILMTLAIVIPFLTIIDFIVGIVNKSYTHKVLLYYIRTYTLWFVFFFMSMELEFFKGGADNRTLIIMVVISYVSLGIVILKPLLKIDIYSDPILQNKNIKLLKCTEELLKQVRNKYSSEHAKKITLDDKTYTLVALDKDQVIGFISTTLIELEPPLDKVVEAHINIIEIKKEYYQYGVANGVAERLIKKTETYFKNTEATQIYGWSTNALIHLWNNLGYTFTLYTKLDDKTKPNIQEYGILKKL